MRNTYRLLEAACIPWDSARGIPEIFVDELSGGLLTARQPRQMRAPVRVRPAWKDYIDLLAADPLTRSDRLPLTFRISSEGDIVQRVELPPPVGAMKQWQILDFALDREGNIYLLEEVITDQGHDTVLRKLSPDGARLWARSAPAQSDSLDLDRLSGAFSQLLYGSGEAVYLAATRHRGLVVRINPDSGELDPYTDWGEWTGEVFMAPDDSIYFVRFVPEQSARSWVCFDPRTGRETQVLCEPNTFQMLAYPTGVDAKGRAYAVKGMSVGCIELDGFLAWFEHIESVVADARKNVLLSSDCGRLAVDGEVDIRVWDMDGNLMERIPLPLPPIHHRSGWWRLLLSDEHDRLWLYGGKRVTQEGYIIVFSAQGKVEEVREWTPDIIDREFRLQPSHYWRICSDGVVILPVLGPEAFHLIKMNHIGESAG